jgi:parallel beta-helix repeat protein
VVIIHGSAAQAATDLKKISPAVSPDLSAVPMTEKALATTVLYVNSRTGNDSTGTGAVKKPFKTITHAMEVAGSGTTIMAEGANNYDEANGEVFPIRMKPGVTLTSRKAESSGSSLLIVKPAVIMGGARYDIPDSPVGRYVAILGADRATISGLQFKAINTPGADSDDGSPILCDSASPTISNNTFSGKAHAGISLLGNSHPFIAGNTITGELSWGITAYGSSYPTVQFNSFSCLNGIDCSDDSYPRVKNNKFSCESTGISVKGASESVLSNNEVKSNGEYGIMVRMESAPIIQGNTILQNPVGIYIAPGGTTNPDIGGGGRSTGGNTFDNDEWNIQHRSPNDISAEKNSWGSSCCDVIKEKIYDKDDDPLSGSVHIGTCMNCRVSLSLNRT